MARRAAGRGAGEFWPQLAVGVRVRAAMFAEAFPGISQGRVGQLDRRRRFLIGAVDAWSALNAVDPAAADVFKGEHGPWREDASEPLFEYDPTTSMLRRVPTQEETMARAGPPRQWHQK